MNAWLEKQRDLPHSSNNAYLKRKKNQKLMVFLSLMRSKSSPGAMLVGALYTE